jgi:hypothetical protein
VTVEANKTTPYIFAQLAAAGSISGRVTAGSSGNGIQDVYIDIEDLDQNSVSYAWTDSNGYYTNKGIPSGNFKAYFETDSAGNYLPEWYNKKGTFVLADVINVLAGSVTPDINAQLDTGGMVSGRVTDGSANGVKNARINIYDLDNIVLRYSFTDSNGDYICEGIRPGNCKVAFDPSDAVGNYLPEWYNKKGTFAAADSVSVTAGQTTPNINAQLAPGGGISGRVVDGSGNGIFRVLVKVFNTNFSQITSRTTDYDGYYTIGGIPEGTYRIWFDGSFCGYASEWYNNKINFYSADALTVTTGPTIGGINTQLDQAGQIKGAVTNGYGSGIYQVIVSCFDLNHNYILSTQTLPRGYYTLGNLKAGTYKVYFDASYAVGNFISKWYQDKTSFTTANQVSVTVGSVSACDATLSVTTSILVTSPAGGTSWMRGTNQSIVWFKSGVQSDFVKILLFKKATLVKTITSKAPNNGSFNWAIPSSIGEGIDYKIKVATVDNKLSSYSSVFTISKPSITVTSPSVGLAWTRGTTKTITWTKAGPQNAFVKIQLFQGITKKLDITLSTDNDGSFDWAIPLFLTAASNYKIKITTVDGKVTSTSSIFSLN